MAHEFEQWDGERLNKLHEELKAFRENYTYFKYPDEERIPVMLDANEQQLVSIVSNYIFYRYLLAQYPNNTTVTTFQDRVVEREREEDD